MPLRIAPSSYFPATAPDWASVTTTRNFIDMPSTAFWVRPQTMRRRLGYCATSVSLELSNLMRIGEALVLTDLRRALAASIRSDA
jgi:hypothetical protein